MHPAKIVAPACLLLVVACSHGDSPRAASSPKPTASRAASPSSSPYPASSPYPESQCDGTTVEMDECVAHVLAGVERELNAVYARVRRDLLAREADGEFTDIDEAHESVHPATELKLAERAFLTYRDRMCAATYDAWVTGTIRTVEELGCELAVTRTQIDRIEAMGGR